MTEHQNISPQSEINTEKRYHSLFTRLEQGVGILEMIFDDDGNPTDYRFVDVNPAFEEQTGLEDPVGKRAYEMIPNLDDFWAQTYGRVDKTRQSAHFENHAPSMDRWFDVYAFPIEEPEKHRVALVFKDITNRKRRELNREFLAELIEDFARLSGSQEIMVLTARKLAEFLDVNRINFTEIHESIDRAWNLYDHRDPGLPEAIGEFHISDYMSPDFIAAVQSGEPVAIDDVSTDRRTADFAEAYKSYGVGSKVHVPHHSDGRWKFLLAVFDRDPRKWREDEIDLLRNLAARLWYRLERARAEEALREADRRKNRFLGILSHELRNPLTPIRLSLQLLHHAPPGSNEECLARETIERQTDQLTRLVDDLLDVTRITRDKIELQRERVELNELVKKTARDYQSMIHQSGIELRVEPAEDEIFVDADQNRLSQVVGNLLQNANKFTPSGGRITVCIAVDRSMEQAEVRVVDTGVGIDTDMMDNLFEPFAQGETDSEHSTEGLGLGLALVKGLIDLHGGEVEVHSEGVGQGSEVVVRLPTDFDDHPVAPSQKVTSSAGALKILLIEDNPDVARSLSMVLQLKGHEVMVESDGEQGLQRALKARPEVVICDIGLPGMDGFDVARALSEDSQYQPLQLVALSGYAQPQDIERSQQAGFDHHLAKPPDVDQLERILSSVANERI